MQRARHRHAAGLRQVAQIPARDQQAAGQLEAHRYLLQRTGNRAGHARIGEIVADKRSITADTAARLGVFFGMEAEFWLNLQAHYDLAIAHEALAANLAAIQPLAAAV
ncbi:MAG TPA: HigA family addiction module antitoxin [Thiobacillus sp.]|nr:HigA family addiction module antitoxin [Thiobacillus sp.]